MNIRIPVYSNTQLTISELKNIVANTPKNLNNNTLVFQFCIPASVAVQNAYKLSGIPGFQSDITMDSPSSSTFYMNKLALTFADYQSQKQFRLNNSRKNKLLPQDIQNPQLLTIDLERYNLSFNYFYGGDVIVWGNNKWFINDIQLHKSDTSDVISAVVNKNLILKEVIGYEISQTLKYLQNNIINCKTPTQSQQLLTVKSNSFNINYSALSFRNNYTDTYLYNMKIENTLSANTIIYIKQYDQVQYNDIIAYWTLEKDGTPQILNKEYLGITEKFQLQSKNAKYEFVNPVTLSTEITGDISTVMLNTQKNEDQFGILYPGFLYFDKLSEDGNIYEKTQSNIIKNILYNKDGKTPNVTLAVWCYQHNDLDNTNNPIISDYDFSTLSGIYVSPDMIKMRQSLSNISTNDIWNTIPTQFINNYAELLDKWVLYFYEFQHTNAMQPGWINKIKENGGISLNEQLLKNPIPGKMRINVHVVYRNKEGKVIHRLLLPTRQNFIQQDTDVTSFNIPGIDPLKNVVIGGVKIWDVNSSTPTDGYALWNGRLRNILLLNTFLSHDQMCNMYINSIHTYYNWAEIGEYQIVSKIDKYSFLGSVYTYNTRNINVEGCILKQNIKTLEDIIIDTETSAGQFVYFDTTYNINKTNYTIINSLNNLNK